MQTWHSKTPLHHIQKSLETQPNVQLCKLITFCPVLPVLDHLPLHFSAALHFMATTCAAGAPLREYVM